MGISNFDIIGLTLTATGSLPAASAANEGAIAYDSTTNTVKFSDGSSWANIGIAGGIGTLDQTYDAGAKTITVDAGVITLASNQAAANVLAISEANAANTGHMIDLSNAGTGRDIDGTGSTWYVSAAGAITAASITATTATLSNATITSLTLGSVDGFTLSGNCTFTTSATTGDGLLIDGSTVTTGDILQVEADAATLNGGNIINCTVDGTSVFDVDEDGSVTISGTASSDAITLTAGDLTLSSGTVNVTANAGDAIDLVPVADGAAVDLNLPAAYNLATGAIDIDGSTGSGPVVEVAFSDAYTGDCLSLNMTNAVGAKCIDITGAGTRTATLVHITDTPGNAAPTFNLDITPEAAQASANLFDIDIAGTGTANVIDIAFAAAYTGDALDIDMTNAVGASAIVLTGAGTRTEPLVTVTDVPTTSAPSIDLNITPGAGVQAGIDIDVAGTQAADVISIDCSAAFTGDLINLTTTNMGAGGQAIVVDGSIANSGAIVSLSTSGISTAAGSVITATSSTQPAAANVGVVGRFLETGNAQATTYAVQIDSTNNEALNVSTGRAHFAESPVFMASPVSAVGVNYVQAAGAANAITVTLNDDTGTAIPLADGLRLTIDLNTRTLQAGANTLDFNGGGAVAITTSTNPAANLGTAYAANGVVELIYSAGATAWLCLAQ